jgi:hypothetical protein
MCGRFAWARERRWSGRTAGRTAGQSDGQPDISRDSAKRTPFLRFPAGNWLFPGADGFTTVYGMSGWQLEGLAHLTGSPPAGSLPCFNDSREKLVHFGSAQHGRTRLVRAHACRGRILISSKFCVKMLGTISRPSGGSTLPKLRFKKKL